MVLAYGGHGNFPYNNVFGVITGSASAAQFPAEPGWQIRLKADPNNVGTFFIGNSGVQAWPLDAGDEATWFLADNLNRFYHSNPSGTLDYLVYWLQR